LSWPFSFILDSQRQPTNWALVNGPIVSFAQQQELALLRRGGYRFVGMSSYQTFPVPENGDTLDYETLCEAWCHCFRTPGSFLRSVIPRALISISDFTDPHRISPQATWLADAGDGFDVVYVGADEEWKRSIKNWSLAAQCIPQICRQLGLRALVVGSPTEDFRPSQGVSFTPPLPWERLLSRIASARCLFVPNVLDPSPRVLAEALCLDVPVVVNRNILGGWKYVNQFTGTFFEDEHDVISAVRACLGQTAAPRNWFCANFGPYLAGRRLLRLLKSVDGQIGERSHVWLAEEREESVPGRSD